MKPARADWQRARRAVRLAAAGGALFGALAALAAYAPAAWLAGAVAQASGERLLLADARGSVWQGSAVPVLAGGPGSRDASVLPGRLHWSLGLSWPGGPAFTLSARQACCIDGTLRLVVEPGFGRVKVTLPASNGTLAHWPAAWLAGLGTPFNTLRLGGWLGLASGGLVAESAQGRWVLGGSAVLTVNELSSRLSTLDTLGSYRATLTGGDTAQLVLSTLTGPLQLSGSGQWTGAGLRFRGEARAAPGSEAVLNNLLNIIGRRQGTAAVITIG